MFSHTHVSRICKKVKKHLTLHDPGAIGSQRALRMPVTVSDVTDVVAREKGDQHRRKFPMGDLVEECRLNSTAVVARGSIWEISVGIT